MAKLHLVSLLLMLPLALSSPKKVILDHDGGIDDFVTMLLLLANPDKLDVLGITILDADCRIEVATNTTLKLLHTLGDLKIPVAVSSLAGANPFPDVWRASGISVDVQPLINNFETYEELIDGRLVHTPGEDYLAELLLEQDEPVTIVATGPLSNIAHALAKHGPAVADKIEEVWWMGGALRAPGNVNYTGHDGTAEWNAFWDPAAMGVVWNSSVPLVLVPLDVTNHVPVTPDLIYRFGRQADHVLAGTIWSRVVSWVYERPDEPYYAWDTLTAACVIGPQLCEREDGVLTFAVVSGPSQGRTALAAGTECAAETCTGGVGGGSVSRTRAVSVISHVDAEEFYSSVLEDLKQ